ncbi:MAG: TRAP transporter substrate-binding protein [Verrucomicrobia bacterium]|nr:TRAP transporter substrate-binding protein [Verrucomicrobiota bacterium]
MKRREFIKRGALGAAAVAATATTSCQPPPGKSPPGKSDAAGPKNVSGKTFNWRMVMVVPRTLPIWGPGMEDFAARVKKLSGGRLNIEVYGAGELVPALQVFDTVSSGQVEMGHSAAYYWEGKVPASVFYTSVPFGMTAKGMNSWIIAGGGQELWDKIYAPHDLKAIPCGNTGVQMGGWFRKEINTIDDFKGLKMRMPGLGGKTIARAGAEPVLVAGAEIFTNLQTGVIDATEWVGPYHDYIMGFHKVVKYYYGGGWHEPGSVLELMINRAAWESLPDDLQEIVKACAGQTNGIMFAQWTAKDCEYFAKIKSEGKTVVREYPLEITHQMRIYAEELKSGIADTGGLAREVYDSFTAFQKTYEDYQELSDWAYVRALKA